MSKKKPGDSSVTLPKKEDRDRRIPLRDDDRFRESQVTDTNRPPPRPVPPDEPPPKE